MGHLEKPVFPALWERREMWEILGFQDHQVSLVLWAPRGILVSLERRDAPGRMGSLVLQVKGGPLAHLVILAKMEQLGMMAKRGTEAGMVGMGGQGC